MAGLIWKLQLSASMIFLLIFASCEKQGEYLPAMTREGRNTIGFKNAEGEIFGGSTHEIDYNGTEQLLSIVFLEKKRVWSVEYKWRLNLELKYNELIDSFQFYHATYTAKYYDYAIDTNAFNNFEITYFNKTKRILSGNFEFNMAGLISYDDTTYMDNDYTEKIQSGRFDIVYP